MLSQPLIESSRNVTQRHATSRNASRSALRDDTNNGCEGDYLQYSDETTYIQQHQT